MRTLSSILGFVTLVALWLGPLPEMAQQSFAAHMALHMGVVAIAAPLIALGIAGGVADPVRRWPQWFPAVPWSIVELLVVWGWHTPALHHTARTLPGGFIAEQASFFIAGLVVWLASLSGPFAQTSERAGAGITALLLTSMHMTLLGALLALTPRALYSHVADGHAHSGPLSAIDDQHLGGAIMLAIGGVAYLAGGLGLTTRLVRRRLAPTEVRA